MNKKKRFYITDEDVALGFRKLGGYELTEGHPALEAIMLKLDPEGYGELTMPMLKKNWLADFKKANVIKAEVVARSKAMPSNKRFAKALEYVSFI